MMNSKLTSINEGLTKIEEIDEKIRQLLEEQEYGEIIKIMPRRMSIITQINIIKEKSGITKAEKKRLDMIFSGANNIQETVVEKRDKINNRLKKHKTVKTQNKKLRY